MHLPLTVFGLTCRSSLSLRELLPIAPLISRSSGECLFAVGLLDHGLVHILTSSPNHSKRLRILLLLLLNLPLFRLLTFQLALLRIQHYLAIWYNAFTRLTQIGILAVRLRTLSAHITWRSYSIRIEILMYVFNNQTNYSLKVLLIHAEPFEGIHLYA